MKVHLPPLHEAMLASLLMVISLIALGTVLAHDYAGRLPAGKAAEIYQDPILQIRGTCGRLRSRLGAFVPLGDLEALYKERVQVLPEATVEPEAVESSQGVAEEARDIEFRVTGIAWSPRRPMAFVNGRGVTLGDVINGWTVGEISKNSVTLTDGDGNEQQVRLYTKQVSPRESETPDDDAPRGNSGGRKAETDAAY
jgi:hypothetical protein